MAENGVRTGNVDQAGLIDDLIGNKDGSTARIAVNALNAQLAGSGAIKTAIDQVRDQVTGGLISVELWSQLQAITGPYDRAGAEVLDSDAGTHANASPTGYDRPDVSNAGRYSWISEWSRWAWIGPTGLSGKAEQSALDALEAGLGSLAARDTVGRAEIDLEAVNTPQVADKAINNAKLADMPEGTLKGRTSAGSGPPSNLTASNVRSLISVEDGATKNATDASLRARSSHTGTQAISTVSGLQGALDGKATTAQGGKADTALQPGASIDNISESATHRKLTSAERSKLAGVATGATKNATDAYLRARSSHTGTQAIATVSGLQGALDGKATTAQGGKADTAVQPVALAGEADRAQLAEARALISDIARGETKEAWSEDTTGEPDVRPAFDGGTLVNVPGVGKVLRITGADVPTIGHVDISPRGVIAARPGTWRVTVKYRRATDPSDPAGHSVSVIFQGLTHTKASYSRSTRSTISPSAADGIQTVTFTASTDAGADYFIPSGAVYWSAFVRIYGQDVGHAVDVIEARFEDITDIVAAADALGNQADESFVYRGPISSGSFNREVLPGRYLITAPLDDGPPETAYGGTWEAYKYGDYWNETYQPLGQTEERWSRQKRVSTSEYTGWRPAGDRSVKGVIPDNVSLNTLTTSGVLTGFANSGYTDLPDDLDGVTESFIISVEDPGDSDGLPGARFVLQRLDVILPVSVEGVVVRKGWTRRLDTLNPSTIGGSAWVPNQKAITQSDLTSTYDLRGNVASGSVFDLTDTGRWLVTGTVADGPLGDVTNGYIEVARYGGFLTYTIRNLYDPSDAWSCAYRVSTSENYGWRPAGDTSVKGVIPDNVSLNTLTTSGVLTGFANSGYTDLPDDLDGVTESFIISVEDPGDSDGLPGARFVLQRLDVILPVSVEGVVVRKGWTRRLDTLNPSTIGGSAWVPNQKAITQSDLTSTYDLRGNVASGSVFDLTDTGRWLVTGVVADGPLGDVTNGYIEVARYGGFLTYTIRNLYDPSDAWSCAYRTSTATNYGWKRAARTSLTGKNIVCFGDSVTEFGDYPEQIGLKTGANVINAGVGGTRMGIHNNSLGPYYDPFSMYRMSGYIASGDFSALITAADDLYTDKGDDNRPQAAALAAVNWNAVDYITIAFGTNDFSGLVPIGQDGDATGATFKGAINKTVTDILTAYPHIQILFVTPLFRARDGGSFVDESSIGQYLADYADAIIGRCAAYNIECFDLLRACGINMLNQAEFLNPSPDQIHPNQNGYDLLAGKISSALLARW